MKINPIYTKGVHTVVLHHKPLYINGVGGTGFIRIVSSPFRKHLDYRAPSSLYVFVLVA